MNYTTLSISQAESNAGKGDTQFNKTDIRNLRYAPDDKARAHVANQILADKQRRAEAKLVYFSRKDTFSVTTKDGYLFVNGTGTGSGASFTYEGLTRVLANLEAIKAVHATMLKVPVPRTAK